MHDNMEETRWKCHHAPTMSALIMTRLIYEIIFGYPKFNVITSSEKYILMKLLGNIELVKYYNKCYGYYSHFSL